MPFRLRRSLCVTLASLSLPGIALADTGYLTWKHKSDAQMPAPAPTVSSGGQDYPVPPSPYGQVGDPFARTLTWSGKGRTEAPIQPAPQQPPVAPAPAPRPVASEAAPQPAPRPVEPHPRQLANVEPLPVPQHPIPQVTAPVPVPQPKPVIVPEAALKPAPTPQSRAQKPLPQAPAVAAKPVPAQQPVPAAPPVQPAPPQTAANGYQVPATSKYASRIAAARAAAAKQEADATPPANATPAKPAIKTPEKAGDKKTDSAKATVPAPSPQLATEETDHVFIPGEQYKNASDAPRLYSLHRAYGLTPDPITVDHNATGALLDSADIDADKVEEKADKTQSDDSSAKTADAAKADTKKVIQ